MAAGESISLVPSHAELTTCARTTAADVKRPMNWLNWARTWG